MSPSLPSSLFLSLSLSPSPSSSNSVTDWDVMPTLRSKDYADMVRGVKSSHLSAGDGVLVKNIANSDK